MGTAIRRLRSCRLTSLALVVFLVSTWSAALVPSGAAAAGAWTWPVEGEVLTAYRNGDDPYAAGQHRGIDIAGEVGDPVRAATPGTVTFAGTAGSSGLTISIRTADGRYDTSYLHLDSLAVGEGDRVEAGGELGTVGVTGRRSVGQPHVHFGVRDAGERHAYHDPLLFLAPAGTPAPQPPPAPVPAPTRPSPLPEPAPRPTPAPKGAPVTASRPARLPHPAPSSSPAPKPAGVPSGAPALPEPARWPAPAAPEPLPGPSGVPDPARGPAARGAAPEPARAGPVEAPEGGFVLGWVLAGIGAAIAAAALAGERRSRGRAPRPGPSRRGAAAGVWGGAPLRPPRSLAALSDRR